MIKLISGWYSFTAPAGELFILAAADSIVSRLDYHLSLFTLSGDCSDPANLEHIACDAPAINLAEGAAIVVTLTEGDMYYYYPAFGE